MTTHEDGSDESVNQLDGNQPTHSQNPGPGFVPLPTAMSLNLSAFGQLIRERRQAAGLTQARLAKLAGVTEVTIRNIENAHNPPSEDTLRRLVEVPQLAVGMGDLPTLRLSDLETDLEFFRKLHWFIAPDYEVLKLWLDFRKQLNSEAGHIDQTYLYLDAESAADYIRMNSAHEIMQRRTLPIAGIAKDILAKIETKSVDVIALGPGDGSLETHLVQCMIMDRPDLRLKFYLLDVSQPLLNVAYRHAADNLSEYQNVFIAGMQGNFYDLPSYQHMLYVPKGRPTTRLFVIFGGTLGNIDNEVRFVRHSLAIAEPGDLLLLHVRRARSEVMTEAAISAADPALTKPFPTGHVKWLGGPIRRYCDDCVETSFRYEVRLDCVVPGSYAIDAVARVRFKDGRFRNISMCRFKSYDVPKLSEALKHETWDTVAQQSNESKPGEPPGETLVLFRKGQPKQPRTQSG